MTSSLYLVAAAAVVLFVLERLFPLRRPKSRLASRLVVNAAVSATAIATGFLIVTPVAASLLLRVSQNEWGLTRLLSANAILQGVVAFLLLDLSFYYWHRANHAWPILWRFHNAHHIDPDLDVTTAVRFHFVEIGFSAAFRALQVIVIGGPPSAFVAYEIAFQLNTLFHHSNVRLPLRAERLLNLFLVTPRMHGIHHSERFHEMNSNWSSVFSWWDRIHGTLRLNVPQSQIRIGVAGYARPQDNTVRAVLAMPFRRQRDYWHDPHHEAPLEREGAEASTRLAE
ncbi:MAG: sterol desaturase family protein [Rhodospirillaceae bacterium]